MPLFVLILLALLVLAWWSGKLEVKQIPSVVLMIAGAGLAARGMLLYGLVGIGMGAFWFAGSRRKLTDGEEGNKEREIAAARLLLGVSAHDDADTIRTRHRSLMAQDHPDKGGQKQRAQQLNAARDLLLAELKKRG